MSFLDNLLENAHNAYDATLGPIGHKAQKTATHVAQGAAAGAARAYDATGLGNIGHALNQSAVAIAHAPADIAGGIKGFYGGAGSKLQGGADNLGQVAVGAANTTGAAVRDLTQPIGAGIGAIGQGIGDLGTGAGGALDKTGEGASDFGKYAGLGLVALAGLATVYLIRDQGRGTGGR